ARRALRPLLDGVDVVHAHGLKAGWLAATLRPRPPLVVSIHNLVLDEVAGWSAPLLRRLEERLPGRADATIAISGEVARRFAGRPGADRIRVIPPAGPPPVPMRSPQQVRA
ncbi:MAG TPA: glycosyl transferase, partial [Acidimicrobiaceae bacterium]|nr:glycosyl transferase [Acidimicrobiaceae bacterium]